MVIQEEVTEIIRIHRFDQRVTSEEIALMILQYIYNASVQHRQGGKANDQT